MLYDNKIHSYLISISTVPSPRLDAKANLKRDEAAEESTRVVSIMINRIRFWKQQMKLPGPESAWS